MKTLRIILVTLLPLTLLFLWVEDSTAQSDTRLSFQGTLKKANGIAADDGEYALTFNLYNVEQGGISLWSETQDVQVTGGIYSVYLGDESELNVAFDEIYYLGVKVNGGAELQPRFRLTSAPYALSLIGGSNVFPGAGTVKADDIVTAGKMTVGGTVLSETHTVQVAGGVLAGSGAPGADGDQNKGYAFGDDKDSGLFSPASGEVSLYLDNAAAVKVTAGDVAVSKALTVGDAGTPGNIHLSKGGTVLYDGIRDWQLVDIDDFSQSEEDWEGTAPGVVRAQIHQLPLNQNTQAQPDNSLTQGWAIYISNQGTMSKEYNLKDIPHENVKVRFTVYAFGQDSWDVAQDQIFAGFISGNDNAIRWHSREAQGQFSTLHGEMTLSGYSNNTVSVYFSSIVDQPWELIGVGNIEVYVR